MFQYQGERSVNLVLLDTPGGRGCFRVDWNPCTLYKAIILFYVTYFRPYNNNTLVVYGNSAADIIYGKPYCRIPTYLVGMVAGYIFYKQNGKPVKMSKLLNGFLWFMATAVALCVVYGPYRRYGNQFPQYASVLYYVFARFSFATAVAWVAIACVFGYGG